MLDRIDNPGFELQPRKKQSLKQLIGLKDYEALKPPFRQIFCSPATSVVRGNNKAVALGLGVV